MSGPNTAAKTGFSVQIAKQNTLPRQDRTSHSTRVGRQRSSTRCVSTEVDSGENLAVSNNQNSIMLKIEVLVQQRLRGGKSRVVEHDVSQVLRAQEGEE
eukprot:3554438-Rhodomonas_salina.1